MSQGSDVAWNEDGTVEKSIGGAVGLLRRWELTILGRALQDIRYDANNARISLDNERLSDESEAFTAQLECELNAVAECHVTDPPDAGAGADVKLPKIPPYTRGDSNWCDTAEAATIEGIVVGTMRAYRESGCCAGDNNSGIDKYGRMWRRDSGKPGKPGTPGAHIFYHRPSLKKV